MDPFISVVIPVYNKVQYIDRAVTSVLAQSYPNFELLLIDDASTDGSPEKIRRYTDGRIRVLSRTEPGPGGYAARNLGIREARGTWVAFLDADDSWMPDHLEHAVKLIERHPGIPVVSSARLSSTAGKETLDPFARRYREGGEQILGLADYLREACEGRRAIGPNSVLIHRESLPDPYVFPEGRTQRSGDLYAWVALMARLKTLVWSPHVASVSYRDVVGVSRTSSPSIQLFRDMVSELAPTANREETLQLKRYANQMIKYAWLQNRRNRVAVPLSLLPSAFFWKHDMTYCLKWSAISLVPVGILEYLHKRVSPITRANA
ncbi:glycosyltransferase family 2 protein [Halomonas cerina]|uniref:Glycosyltransferase involved in cell wall biosynthesis n=1 Tax=Halomonas cerina TaxID=447424 RepID=A0A839VA40_9GAMM|nr:glycosyltransferase family A protein [Halomonas cerina]MBB3189406.1 glycosyltransferase involved in cell wall biosynthesis [Halomonas cerina]